MPKIAIGDLVLCSAGCGNTTTYSRGRTKKMCKDCRDKRIKRQRKARDRSTAARAIIYEQHLGKTGKTVKPSHARGLVNSDAWYTSCGEAYVDRVMKRYPNGKYLDQRGVR